MTDYFDSGREREFNTYYDAYRALSSADPPYTNLFDAEAAARHEPRLASDPTLTAFCQLGALRLDTKRCMIFFFDQTNGYVLAESTQSHHSGHTQELWLGNTIIPRGLSVCEHTVNIPEGNQGSNQDQSNAGDVHIINNFLEDKRFCERPYVKDAPHARFYAGVPIATPSGTRIGAYCVLDDAPRHGINDEDVDFLKHMATLVMHHLVILRESAEYGRGARMLQGLGVITRHDESTSPVEGMVNRVEDANIRREPRSKNLTRASSPPSSYTPMLSEYVSDFAAETDSVSRNRQKSSQQQIRSSSGPPHASQTTATKTQSAEAATPEISAVQPPPLARAPPSDESSSSYHTDGSVNDTLDKQIRKSFQRASSLLLEAVKSDGVVFLDATATKSVSSHATSRRFSASSDCSTSESDGAHSSIAAPSVVNSGAKCGVLGHSEADGVGGVPSFDNMLTERFLKSLMRRYPKGKTWTFDANGKESSEEFLQDLAGSIPQLDDSTSRNIAQTLRETPKLQRLFCLGLRTLCFAPMWDPVRERWYAAALTWSKSPQHGFSRSSELSYLNAFCDVTMAEILRIESKQEARSRAALMSSFSHDLRSPLHGILGSIDLLKGAGTLDWSLVEQVQKCSLNLVDVIDHLLDFAEINNKEQPPRTSDSGHDGKVDQLRPPRKVSSQRVSLSRTTEAIVDAVFYSHYFTKQDRTQPHVDLVLDLTPRSATQCMISVGAWKRLCTNIVNNALKYTPKGHVKVSLDIIEHQNEDKHAVLTVSDTGIGMSQEFLQGSLFKSFAQEDSFATGTGLGMSLVAELIKEFGGQIEVTSKKGEGTTMTITVPLDVPQETVEADTASNFDCSDICIGYFEPHEAQTGARSSRQMLTDTAKRTLRDIGVTFSDASDTGVVMIFEEHFMQLPNEAMTGRQRWLVLCDSFASATRLREQHQGVNVEFVPQPYGPERLSTALQILCKSLPVQVGTGAGSDSTVSGAIDRQMASLVQSRNRARSALPSPPLDVALDYLNLSSPNASTVKAATPELEHIGTGKSAHKLDATAVDAVARGPDVMATPTDRSDSTIKSSQPCGPLFLLLVDDNPINLKLLAMVADRNHYPRILATNGQEAVDAYKSPETATRPPQQSKIADQQIPAKRPDVVLLDLNMPIMNGFEAARQIRQYEKLTEATSPAVIVAITGLGDDIARAKAYQHGFDLFMSKPVRPKDVTDLLESIVQARAGQND